MSLKRILALANGGAGDASAFDPHAANPTSTCSIRL